MRTLLALSTIALALPIYADTLTYSISELPATDPVGRHVAFSGSLDVPLFDSQLGVLDSIQYSFGVMGMDGGLKWKVLSAMNVSYAEFAVTTQTQFLGVTDTHQGFGISGGSGNDDCGPLSSRQPVCLNDTRVRLAQLDAVMMNGTITQGSTSVRNPLWYESMATTTLLGAPQGSLDGFTGSGSIALPYSIAIDAIGPVYWSVDQFGPTDFVLGDLDGTQQVRVFGTWDYSYTPVIVSTEAPEPRLTALIGLALAGLWWRNCSKGTCSGNATSRC